MGSDGVAEVDGIQIDAGARVIRQYDATCGGIVGSTDEDAA